MDRILIIAVNYNSYTESFLGKIYIPEDAQFLKVINEGENSIMSKY